MQIKFIDTSTLEANVVNLKGATLEETLAFAKSDFYPNIELDKMVQNENILSFPGFIADIIYAGVPKSDRQSCGRQKDWTNQLKLFTLHYDPKLTAKQLHVKSGLSLSEVYQLSKKENKPLAKGARGRKPKK